VITLITGVPGAGKTLRAVSECLRQVQKGRLVYSINCDDFTAPGVETVESGDWRDVPDGSFVFIDEAQMIFRSGKRDLGQLLTDLELHRHHGLDILLTTQHPRLLHSGVLPLVGRHEHLERIFGSSAVRIFWNDRAMNTSSRTDLKGSQQMEWRHPKKVYKVYKSANKHPPRKLQVPRLVLVVGVFAVAYVIWLFDAGMPFIPGAKGEETAKVKVEKSAVVQVERKPPVEKHYPKKRLQQKAPVPVLESIEVGGCISSQAGCLCVDPGGVPLDLAQEDCRKIARRPLRRPVRLATGTRAARVLPSPGGAQ
jgi:zona occludens toxin